MKKKLIIIILFIILLLGLLLLFANKSNKAETKKSDEKVKIEEKVEVNEKEKVEPKVEETKIEEKVEEKKVEETKPETPENNVEKSDDMYYINGILIANKTYALPSSYNPGGLLPDFNNNFSKMQQDASSEGIKLTVISGFRSYERQTTLYNNYVARDGKEAADTYSARPGHSEHQTGLAADINSLEQSFISTNEGKWLNDNCYKYGFIIRYPKGKENKTGYIYEPWHIRYVGVDIAKILYNNGNWITLEEYFNITSEYN